MENELLIIIVYGRTSIVITTFVFKIKKNFSINFRYYYFFYEIEEVGHSMTSSWS